MGDLSQVGAVERIPLRLEVPAHWADHRFQGRSVLPAVEAMQLMAFQVGRLRPQVDRRRIWRAAFDKFLELPAAGAILDAFCDLADRPDGGVQASLVTRSHSGKTAITRTKVHAQMIFPPVQTPEPEPPALAAVEPPGFCMKVAPGPLYETLVPFGPAYRNITQPLLLSRAGAQALMRAPELVDSHTDLPLGSPFVADAAFHAACVWSQRFAGLVAFPVGIGERRIANRTRPGETYACHVFAPTRQEETLLFDIWILDLQGRLRERLSAVRMRDVSGGRLSPPEWICEKA